MKLFFTTLLSLLIPISLVFAQKVKLADVVVSTLSGAAGAGSSDGDASVAKFKKPVGIAVDTAGNIYIGDNGNNKIRKISKSGIVTTLAGSGSLGSSDGKGSGASFKKPMGIAVDLAGNVYVADVGSNKIRVVLPSGLVRTLAGSVIAGSFDGKGADARFNLPMDVDVDKDGNVYVADAGNNLIRKITPTGLVTTVAGSLINGSTDGQDSLASFNYPRGIAIDLLGNIFVADMHNHKIRKITPSGLVSTFAGTGVVGSDDGDGTVARFNGPTSIAIDTAGNLYVTDAGNNLIRLITSTGSVSTLAGSKIGGTSNGHGSNAKFQNPIGIALDPVGNVLVADYENNLIRRVVFSDIINDFEDEISSTFLKLYPNPVQNVLNISLSESVKGNILICDLRGAVVLNESIDGNQLSISIESLYNGVYVLKLVTESNSTNYKVLVSR